ncbi:hypothetical protein ACRALDRAFT_1058200 [Sodiomyces alcalophilus JCM 7366]|uniref:uncharacterized protein n=1 Tax=Sodiomyces alcalophilus JCM 7366 TaxID=591952 RepID=UPI0039B3E044
MASSRLDVSTLTSSTDIFSTHTLPQIRAIHKALHVEIEEKASRLRTQVGSSYRDLLGTADAIVQMRADNDALQDLLGGMGARCGRAVVAGKVSGLGSFASGGASDHAHGPMGVVARAKLYDACSLVASRILKGGRSAAVVAVEGEKLGRGDRLLLASKVLVLSRLLGKRLGEEDQARMDEDVRLAVETARKNLEGLKRRLHRNIDKLLRRVTQENATVAAQEDVLKALCAYSLTTSSGARIVLQHFLRVRGEAVATAFNAEEGKDGRHRSSSSDDVLRSLTLYTRTLLDVQALVPSKLSDALATLKKRPLLADESLRTLEGLRLDLYERWCGQDIQFFTPFIRHDDIDGPHARSVLSEWAEGGAKAVVAGLATTMERMTEFKTITELRTKVLQLWIREGGKVRGFDPLEMLHSLRGAINKHMLHMLETKVDKLHLVADEVSAALESGQDGGFTNANGHGGSLWDVSNFDADLAAGVNVFLQHLVAQAHGRNDAVSRVVDRFTSWSHVVDEVGDVVAELRKQRWDNDTDDMIEDEETIEERHQLLSKDDPRALQEKFGTALEKAFGLLNRQLAELWASRADAPDGVEVAMYFLRVLRDVRAGLPKQQPPEPQQPQQYYEAESIKKFGLDMVPSLHDKLVATVFSEPLETFASQVLSQRVVVGRALWEGSDPELPVQPSPRTFHFLRDLSVAMDKPGVDLWSGRAVSVAKAHLRERICEMWSETVEAVLKDAEEEKDDKEEAQSSASEEKEAESGDKDGATDGKASEEPEPAETGTLGKEQQRRDLFIQWLFDIKLLRCVLGKPGSSEGDEFGGLEDQVYEHTGLDTRARERIAKSAGETWTRTSLLFGLLT